MLKRKIRLKITSASRQTIRLGGQGLPAHCPACGREVRLVTKAEAQGILRVDGPALDVLIAAGLVHLLRTVSGNLHVCKDSLFLR